MRRFPQKDIDKENLEEYNRLNKERSHSGLVQVFAKHPGCYSPREFESLPLRHSCEISRGVAQLAEQRSPKAKVAGSIPATPAISRSSLPTIDILFVKSSIDRLRWLGSFSRSSL